MEKKKATVKWPYDADGEVEVKERKTIRHHAKSAKRWFVRRVVFSILLYLLGVFTGSVLTSYMFFLGATEYSEQIAQALISMGSRLSDKTEIQP